MPQNHRWQLADSHVDVELIVLRDTTRHLDYAFLTRRNAIAAARAINAGTAFKEWFVTKPAGFDVYGRKFDTIENLDLA